MRSCARSRKWYDEGETFGLATVVSTFRSAPRQPGASMAVSADGEAVGSVSGGCVEGAVYELAQEVLASGRPVVQRYGVTDDDAFAVGLTCGGILDILVEPVGPATFPLFGEVRASIERHEPVAVATIIEGPGDVGRAPRRLAGPRLRRPRRRPAWTTPSTTTRAGCSPRARPAYAAYGRHGERRLDELAVFVHSFAPPPRMLVFGAIDFAAAVARVGKFLGYHVTVCDARPVFATPKRFPEADEVVVKWPHKFLTEARTSTSAR